MNYDSIDQLPKRYREQARRKLDGDGEKLHRARDRPESTVKAENIALAEKGDCLRKGKYNNQKIEYKGLKFDSVKEYHRYLVLEKEAILGNITKLEMQVPFELLPTQRGKDGEVIERACEYKADFTYYDKDGNFIVEDVKGMKTEVYKIKKKLMLFRFGIVIKET